MSQLATISDIKQLAAIEALSANRKILGVTLTQARYESFPDASDPTSVKEFVTDIFVLNSPTQAVVLGLAGGYRRINNVLIGTTAQGDLISDFNVPVEVVKNSTGQLMIIGRAKVSLPTLRVDEYGYRDLQVGHISELKYVDGRWIDPFGYPVLPSHTSSDFGAVVSLETSAAGRLSRFDELDKDDDGNVIGLDINPFQRTIVESPRIWTVNATETVGVTETETT